MDNLESKVELPFKIGTYNFDLNWKWFKIGTASLTYARIKCEDLPQEAKQVYKKGDLYKVIFKGKIDLPVIKLIIERGEFTTYCAINKDDVQPLLAKAETRILRQNRNDTAIYDYQNNLLTINNQKQKVDSEAMKTLRDPASHVLHLLFLHRTEGGKYFCGNYHSINGEICPLEINYELKDDKLIGHAKISAQTYFIDTELLLELPYTFDAQKKLYLPSLKEKVAIVHRIIGKVTLDFT